MEANIDHCQAKIIITSQNRDKTCPFQSAYWDISGLLPGSKLSAQDTMHSSLIACNLHKLPSCKKSYIQVLSTRNCYKTVWLTLYFYHFSAVNVTISDLTPVSNHSVEPLTPRFIIQYLFESRSILKFNLFRLNDYHINHTCISLSSLVGANVSSNPTCHVQIPIFWQTIAIKDGGGNDQAFNCFEHL